MMQSSVSSKSKLEAIIISTTKDCSFFFTNFSAKKWSHFFYLFTLKVIPQMWEKKSVEEMNTNVKKNDRGMWPNGFLKL